jgi:ribosome maturation factor RimP
LLVLKGVGLAKEVFLQELTDLISGSIIAWGLELVELNCRPENKRLVIAILADKPEAGISIQECALLCRRLKDLLEEKNIISSDYVLEVSSPGLDRPLKSQKDFMRSLNKEVVFYLNQPVSAKFQWQGVVSKTQETSVFIQTGFELLEIPLAKINKAKLVI